MSRRLSYLTKVSDQWSRSTTWSHALVLDLKSIFLVCCGPRVHANCIAWLALGVKQFVLVLQRFIQIVFETD